MLLMLDITFNILSIKFYAEERPLGPNICLFGQLANTSNVYKNICYLDFLSDSFL